MFFATLYSQGKKQVTHLHLKIVNVLLKLIKQEQAVNEITMIQYAAGQCRVKRRRKYREIDKD
ncbi:hypothetical protein KUTeg_022293 [Tegillarca granosa]|uniref:Uncharacterized protein n=1 Tax=Tegillarca granosa TaxID=220873 RepID=A0ABQ9E5Z8_TEGGR|nr:hypothetical protein KUTeg_022293 [Tegillarca granosa]